MTPAPTDRGTVHATRTTYTRPARPARRRRARGERLVLAALLTISSLVAMGWGASASAATAATAATPALGHLLLTGANVPTGWKKIPPSTRRVSAHLGCTAALDHPGKGWRRKKAVFANGKGFPFVADTLATGPHVKTRWRHVRRDLAHCRATSITVDGTRRHVRVTPYAISTGATGTVASRWQLVATGLALGIDVVVFREHKVIGEVSYTDAGRGDVANAEAFADAAVSKAGGGRGAVTGVVSVATAPIRVAATRDGDVAYRKVGSGPPLVLVMGYSGSMEAWEPQFVNALAHHFTVVIFDNAGIGKTASRRPLTIDAMAQQTSALMHALHLGDADVLGWSMGGLIAQSLAVRHPAQVHRLVLCATYPGTGAVRPSPSILRELGGGTTTALSLLFPPGHQVAATVYTTSVSMYLERTPAPASVVLAQGNAVLQAWVGNVPGLARYRQIAAPTLVADGTRDLLVPAANPRALAGGIGGATLTLYKDAGHAFLFQKLGRFVPAVESFLTK